MKDLIIYGSKEFARIVKVIAFQCGRHCVGFIDDFNEGQGILGTYKQIQRKYSPTNYEIVIAIGYKSLRERWNIYNMVLSDGYEVASLLHPKAIVSDQSIIGQGSIIMAGAILDANAELGELVVMWPGTVVNHDSKIEANTFLSPNSTICGGVMVGQNCFIGAGAIVVDHVTVPSHSFIKAGSVFK